jgi:hypothetical protein
MYRLSRAEPRITILHDLHFRAAIRTFERCRLDRSHPRKTVAMFAFGLKRIEQ